MAPPREDGALAAAARTLKADAVAAEVVPALREHGVRSILIKGASTAALLYDATEARPYSDCDLLLSPSGFDLARGRLLQLGFTEHPQAVTVPARGLPHAVPWTRADGASLDLHRNLSGTGVPPAEVWGALVERTAPLRVAGVTVEVSEPAGVALQVALHADQHGGGASSKPMADLSRAIARIDRSAWESAAQLAERLGALGPFSEGLRRTPPGADLADLLALPASSGDPRRSRVLIARRRVAAAPGVIGKARALRREVLPGPTYMRWWDPRAGEGSLALARAYGARAAAIAQPQPGPGAPRSRASAQ